MNWVINHITFHRIKLWCGYKITGLMLEHFYLKNYTIEMLSPSMYPLPDPYPAPCKSSTVGSNAAGHLLIAYSWAPSLLPSLHLRTRTWFFLTQTRSLEIKKSHMGLGQVSTVDVPTRGSCASSKTSRQTGRCVPACCLGEEPMSRSSTFQVFFSPVHAGLSKPPCSRPG